MPPPVHATLAITREYVMLDAIDAIVYYAISYMPAFYPRLPLRYVIVYSA